MIVMSLIRFRALCVSIAALVALIGDVAAQQPTSAQQSAIRQSCRNDFQAMCVGVQPGGSAALQCLQQNAAKASPACQQALSAVGSGGGGASTGAAAAGGAAAAAAAAAAAPAAAAPMQQQGMQPQGMQQQGGGMGQMAMRDEFRLTREACGSDYRTYCQRVQPGGGRALTCLEANAASLSPVCQKALMAMKQQMGK
jgi:Cysteine rich repeat